MEEDANSLSRDKMVPEMRRRRPIDCHPVSRFEEVTVSFAVKNDETLDVREVPSDSGNNPYDFVD